MNKNSIIPFLIILFASCKNNQNKEVEWQAKLDSIQQQLDVQKDRQQIVDLAYRFSDAVMRADSISFSSLWTQDAVWIINAPLNSKLEGRENIIKEFTPRMKALDYFINFSTNYTIDIHGNEADALFYVLEAGQFTTGKKGYYNYAVYKDKLIKKENAWYFKNREYKFIYLDNSAMKGMPIVTPFQLSNNQSSRN